MLQHCPPEKFSFGALRHMPFRLNQNFSAFFGAIFPKKRLNFLSFVPSPQIVFGDFQASASWPSTSPPAPKVLGLEDGHLQRKIGLVSRHHGPKTRPRVPAVGSSKKKHNKSETTSVHNYITSAKTITINWQHTFAVWWNNFEACVEETLHPSPRQSKLRQK